MYGIYHSTCDTEYSINVSILPLVRFFNWIYYFSCVATILLYQSENQGFLTYTIINIKPIFWVAESTLKRIILYIGCLLEKKVTLRNFPFILSSFLFIYTCLWCGCEAANVGNALLCQPCVGILMLRTAKQNDRRSLGQ